MYKNLKSNNGFSVFNAFFFTVTRHRYSILEVPWRRIHNVIALAMSMFNNTPHSALLRHSLPQGAREYGRSMIEMLGVLAIIGVLSVGGIAGYSKAMEKWKTNKLLGDYNMLIVGLIEHHDSIIKSISGKSGEILLNDIVLALNIVPNSWKVQGRYLNDGHGNLIYPYVTNEVRFEGDFSRIVIDFNVGGLSANENSSEVSANFSDKLCVEMFNNLVIPLSSFLQRGYIYQRNHGDYNTDEMYFGDKYCSAKRKCLKDMTLSDIHSVCNSCDKANQRCNITISF